jgi:predicted metal-dependent peptidase
VTETGGFEMMYNPEFFASLRSDKQRAAVIKHEYYHLIFEHVTGRLPKEGMSKLWNIATDLAINSHLIDELPKKIKIPGSKEKVPLCIPGGEGFEIFPPNQSSEFYYNALKEKSKDNPEFKKAMEESDSFDEHEGWGNTGNVSNTAEEIAKEKAKKILKESMEECDQKAEGYGTVSRSIMKEIKERVAPKLDWRAVLKFFVNTSQKANKSSSIKKVNKRYPYIHPGKKTSRAARIAVSIDQSGSVGTELLKQFFSELEKLAALAEFTVIPFDTKVDTDKIFVWKKGEKNKFKRVFCGGTCFNAPTDYVNKNKFDGHIILTDMGAPKPKNSKCARLWITNSYWAAGSFKTHERIITVD